MNTVEVGKFIAELRKNRDLTQKELARKLNVTDKAVSKWETGRCYPDIEMIMKLSEFFSVSVNDIVSGKITEGENRDKVADNNLVSVMKSLDKAKMRWIITSALSVTLFSIMIFGFVAFIHTRPVSFDSGACSGGFGAYIFQKYGDELTEMHFEKWDADEIDYHIVTETHSVSWADRLIFLEFDVIYTFANGEENRETLQFIGERYWTEKYSWREV
ncbi:MAG: helix-turn-helix transcriptional regulator [Clostridia bacterium]|nr:helix-turn-helix transcriptional regulator [Clostridia bacterium]